MIAIWSKRILSRSVKHYPFLHPVWFEVGIILLIENYALKTGINHWLSGFASKDELIKYCEFCVEYGDEMLRRIRYTAMKQLEIEDRMTKDEICKLNIKKLESEIEVRLQTINSDTNNPFCEACQNLITVQDQVTNYIKLSLIVSALKEFFREYYKGLKLKVRLIILIN